jgi:predicted acyltransferase
MPVSLHRRGPTTREATLPRDDTLTTAEAQALARARRTVERARGGERRATSGGRSGRPSDGTDRKRTPTRSRTRKRRRTPRRSATLDTARGVLLLAVVGLGAAPTAWLPSLLRPVGGDGFGLLDLAPAAFAVLAGVALDHQLHAHRRASGRWWAGRLIRRVVVLIAAGLLVAWLARRDPAALRWTSPWARIGLATTLAWFLLRDLSRRAQVVLVAAWVVTAGLLAWRGDGLLVGADARLLPGRALAPIDPDGLLGVLATTVLVVVGAWLGSWLRARPPGPATALAFGLTAGYVGAAGVVWAQLSPVNAATWTGPTLLLGTSAGLLLLALGHLLAEVLSVTERVRWITAAGAVALPVGLSAVVTGHVAGVGGTDGAWAWATGDVVLPVLGRGWGTLAVVVVTAAVAARGAAALVDRGWILRA